MTTRLIPKGFPSITAQNSAVTSLDIPRYNCIAWAANDDTRWWWPVPASSAARYWPSGASNSETVVAFIEAFSTLGYMVCKNSDLEVEFEKVVLYVNENGTPTHMARQLSDGSWTSKIGKWHDISHATADVIEGPTYGVVHLFMSRKRI